MTVKTFAFGALVAALSTTAVQADEIRATSSFGPSHVLATAGYPALFARLSEFTNGAWTGNDTPSGLLAPNEMNAGLRDGISEMGPIILPYFAADYPESGIVGELSILGTDNRAIASAVTEYIVTCAECQAEFARNGHVFLGSDATTNYQFLSTRPIHSLADMQGLRIRTAGSVFTRFLESLGAEAVQMPSSELFEGLSSGVIDATYSSVADLQNAQLYDVVSAVTLVDLGVFNAAGMTNASHVLWNRMNPDEREALAHAAQYAQTIGIQSWIDNTNAARAEGESRGIEFITPDADLQAAVAAFRTEHLATVAATLTERGVTNAAEKVQRYADLLARWEVLVQDVTTAEELAELRYREIWAHVDYSTYGQ
ncbi:C4-dicarboxylate TRAP transporter substrate-binding protein [Pararhodobacter marinus]|uniref:C4-dicarboxylate TRAP transporter substrate-binding protein n=1 Tax=Pararhodobacter marinus TaxID=2184063 RepID=UPI003516C139